MKIVKKRTRKKLKYAKLTKKNKLLKKSKKNTKKILRGGVGIALRVGRSLKNFASKSKKRLKKTFKRQSKAEKAAAKAAKKSRKEAKSKAKAEAKAAKKSRKEAKSKAKAEAKEAKKAAKEAKSKAKAEAKEAKKAKKEAKKKKSKGVNDGNPTLNLSGDIPGGETSTDGPTEKKPSRVRRAVNKTGRAAKIVATGIGKGLFLTGKYAAKGAYYAGKGSYYAGKALITTGRVANKVLFGTSFKSSSTPKLQKNHGSQDMLMQMMIAQQMQQNTSEQIKEKERDPKFTEEKARLLNKQSRNNEKIMKLKEILKKEGIDIPKDLNDTKAKLQELQLEEKELMKEAFEDKYIIIDKKLQNSIKNYNDNIINGIIHYCHRNRKKCGGKAALKSENTFEEYVKFLKENNIITEKTESNA